MRFRNKHVLVGVLAGLMLGPISLEAASFQELAVRCVKARAKSGLVRILQFGDSHLATLGAQRNFIDVFQTQFGNGGPGFGLPWVKPQAGLRARTTPGWRKAQKGLPTGRAGLQSGWIEASRSGETATVEGVFSRVRIHFLGLPGGGSAQVLLDGSPLGEVSLSRSDQELVVFDRPCAPSPGNRRLEVVARGGGPVRMIGLSLEQAAGAVTGFMAANGVQASWLLDVPEDLFAAQVQAESPDLVVLSFGTNEANDRLFDPEQYRRTLSAILGRFKKAAPEVEIALAGPPDARLPRSLPGALDAVVAVQREVAERIGAYFWDQREHMGGSGSIDTWMRSGWAGRDGVHFTPEGYRKLAYGFLGGFLGRLGQAKSGPLVEDPKLAQASQGAFRLPAAPSRNVLPPPVAEAAAPAPASHTIYVFRTADGRTIITDNPQVVAGEQGEWVGNAPR